MKIIPESYNKITIETEGGAVYYIRDAGDLGLNVYSDKDLRVEKAYTQAYRQAYRDTLAVGRSFYFRPEKQL